jgi:glycosyltransferase involved in cell wall biosynthesis
MISIIIPCYNEELAIKETVDVIKKTLENKKYEIIVVNDKSTDGSKEILAKIEGIKVLNHPYNKGYSASLKTGLLNAKYDWIGITDADGTYPNHEFKHLLEFTKDFDMVVGSRTKRSAKYPLIRKPAKLVIATIANFVAERKIPDINSGLRIFKKSLAMKFFHLYPSRFSFTTTITLAALTNDYNVKYIPITYYKRMSKSTMKPIKDTINFIWLLLRIGVYFKPIKVFSSFAAFLFIIALSTFIISFIFTPQVWDITVILFTILSIQTFFSGLIVDVINRRSLAQ